MTADVGAIILAAGFGRRFGADKRLASLGAGTVAGRLLDADGHATAVGESPRSVLNQLKEFVLYLGKNDWQQHH